MRVGSNWPEELFEVKGTQGSSFPRRMKVRRWLEGSAKVSASKEEVWLNSYLEGLATFQLCVKVSCY